MIYDNQTTAVTNVQRYLRQLSYFNEDIPALPVDGIYGPMTREAVRVFQKSEGLPVTGVVDRATFDLLYQRYRESVRDNTPPVGLSIYPRIAGNYTIKEGDKSFLVEVIQYVLSELELVYDGYGALPVTGTYGWETVAAVKDFQKKHGLPETGEVGRATWDALAETYNRAFGDPSEQ